MKQGRIYWNMTVVDGKACRYEYRVSWGKKYYSVDGGDKWYATKTEALATLASKQLATA